MTFTDTTITPERIRELAESGPRPAAPAPEPPPEDFPGYREEGRAYFRDPGGQIYSVPETEAGRTQRAERTFAPATAEDVAKWRDRPGALESAASQFGRGVLDALLAPGALVGASAEGLGELFDAKTLKDFGRDLGRAASGKGAIEAGAFVAGGSDYKATDTVDAARRRLRDQEKGWPMLSAVSRISGMAAFGLGTGALASGGARAGALVAGGAVEGAGGGAQAAYEQGAAARDVLKSTLLGATIGGAFGLGAVGASRLTAAAPRIKQALREEGVGAAFEVTGGALGGTLGRAIGAAPDVAEALTPAAKAVRQSVSEGFQTVSERSEVQKISAWIRGAAKDAKAAIKRAGVNPETRMESARIAAREAADRAIAKAGDFDVARWADKAPNAVQKVGYRGPLLERISTDLSGDFGRLKQMRPGLDFEIDPNRLRRLTRGIDETAAIGMAQRRVQSALEQIPNTGSAPILQDMLDTVRREMATGGAVETMTTAHRAAGLLSEFADNAGDEVASNFARRTARDLMGEISSERWGKAGALYRELAPTETSRAAALAEASTMRDFLRAVDGKGRLGRVLDEEALQIERAFRARQKLTGEASNTAFRAEIKTMGKRARMAEEAMTIDGGPASTVLEYLQNNAEGILVGQAAGALVGHAIGGLPGAAIGYMVANKIRPRISSVVPHLRPVVKGVARGAPKVGRFAVESARKAAPRYLSPAEERETYDRRVALLSEVAVNPEASGALRGGLEALPEIPGQAQNDVLRDSGRLMLQLLRDMPKPTRSLMGRAESSMSREDVRRANAMWEATFDPLSIFDDFASGLVDYTKVEYTWKQYPGLKQAAQAGMLDVLQMQLSDDEISGIPHAMLTQIDNLLGFDGRLQPSVAPDFSTRVSAMAQQAEAQEAAPRPPGPLKIPDTATYTQRVAQRS